MNDWFVRQKERANGKLTKIVKSLVRTRNFPRRLNSSYALTPSAT